MEATPLALMAASCYAATFLLLPVPLFALRRVSREGGALAVLGVGSRRVGAAAAARLGRWDTGLTAFVIPWVVLGILVVLGVAEAPQEGAVARWHGVVYGLYNMCIGPLLFSYILAMKTASYLASHAVRECRRGLLRTAATDPAWDAVVVPATLELARTTLPTLSAGFGGGLCAFGGATWLFTLGSFATFLEQEQDGAYTLFMMVFSACLPLVLAMDVAAASTDCDGLLSALNAKRMATMDLTVDAKVALLEAVLTKLNGNRGLGFVVSGKVVDRAALKSVFATILGGLVTAVPVILALQPKSGGAGDDGASCDLSVEQRAMLRAYAGLVLGPDATAACAASNLTLGAILRD